MMRSLYQTPSHRMFGIAGFAGSAVCILVLPSVTPPATWILIGCALGWGYLGYRLKASGALVQECTLTVVNPFSRSFTVQSSEVERFEMARWGPFPFMGYVVLKEGARVHIWGIQARNPSFIEHDRDIDDLMDRLASWLDGCRERMSDA